MGWGTREIVGEKKGGLGGRMGKRGSQNKGHTGFQCSASWPLSLAQVMGLPMDSQSTLALLGSCVRPETEADSPRRVLLQQRQRSDRQALTRE